MATWLHEVDVYAQLANGEPGRARDWATTRLALAAPGQFSVFPNDERAHDVIFAAAPPNTLPALIDAVKTQRPTPSVLANAAAALGMYGLLPADSAPLAEALKGGFHNDGDEADVWLAYALSGLGQADMTTLVAASKHEGEALDWVLPIVLLRVTDGTDSALDAATEVVDDLFARAKREPHRLLALLAAMGLPVPSMVMSVRDLDQAMGIGAHLAHGRQPVLKLPPGSAKRRQQAAIKALLTDVAGPAANLLRAVAAREMLPEWGFYPAAVAAWLQARANNQGHGDALHDVLYHAAGGDPASLTAARAALQPEHRDALRTALNDEPDIAAVVLGAALLRDTNDADLADAILRVHGGNLEADVRTTALACVAAFHRPDVVPDLLASTDAHKRALGLVVAEWVPTQEVLAALLAMPVPAQPGLRLQYARDLAAMADAATVPYLEGLLTADPSEALLEAKYLAQDLLHVAIGK